MSSLPAGYPADVFGAFALLKTRNSLSITDLSVLALIEAAGEGLYAAIAANVEDPECKALLKRNGQEERGHAHRMLKAIALKGGSFTLPADSDNPYIANGPASLPADAGFLAMLATAEDDGDLVYQQWADGEADPEVAKLLRLNGREEARHGERVNEVKKRLGLAA